MMKRIFDHSPVGKTINYLAANILVLLCPLILFADNVTDGAKPMDIFTANEFLSKTINIGFTLDAPREGAWGHSLSASEFSKIKEAGF